MPSLKPEAPNKSQCHPWQWALVLVVLTGVAVLMQWLNAAYSADIGADPDEPAHAVTSLMMRDYLASGMWKGVHPMKFAQDYYDHFPKVALGHYPPAFYGVAGLWLLPAASKTALMALIGLLAGGLGTLTAALGLRSGLDRGSSLLVGFWLVLLPVTQKQSMLVMSDLLLVIGCLSATWLWARFLVGPTVGRGLLFGVVAAFAILVKGSAMALALVPVISIVVLKRWSLLKRWSFWLAPLPVVLTALPWTLLTMEITKEGMLDQSVSSYFPEAFKYYAEASVYTFGWVLLLVATIGVGRWIYDVLKCRSAGPLAVSMLGFAVALVGLYLVSPTGLSARYLLPLAPLLVISAAHGWWVRRADASPNPYRYLAIIVVMKLSIGTVDRGPVKVASGFGTVASRLLDSGPPGKVLVISDARGEGGLVAELAFRSTDRLEHPWTVVRGSKFMSKSDWIGRGYQAAFASAEEFRTAAQQEGIAWVVEDTGVPEGYVQRHHQQLAEWSATWSPAFETQAEKQWVAGKHALKLFHLPSITKP
ncbi:MAG: hypothetical protein JNM99_03430 [Verrucomicrobiaceae bacterium]|nr:hypothetical protein [Verrucomicrobiaceae bacterium]